MNWIEQRGFRTELLICIKTIFFMTENWTGRRIPRTKFSISRKTIFLSQKTGEGEDFLTLNFCICVKKYVFYDREMDRVKTSSH